MNTNNKKVFAASSIFMFCAVFILVVGIVASRTVVADADFYPQQEVEEKEYEPVVPFFVKQQCDIYENKPLHS
jgi:hypothetical protein